MNQKWLVFPLVFINCYLNLSNQFVFCSIWNSTQLDLFTNEILFHSGSPLRIDITDEILKLYQPFIPSPSELNAVLSIDYLLPVKISPETLLRREYLKKFENVGGVKGFYYSLYDKYRDQIEYLDNMIITYNEQKNLFLNKYLFKNEPDTNDLIDSLIADHLQQATTKTESQDATTQTESQDLTANLNNSSSDPLLQATTQTESQDLTANLNNSSSDPLPQATTKTESQDATTQTESQDLTTNLNNSSSDPLPQATVRNRLDPEFNRAFFNPEVKAREEAERLAAARDGIDYSDYHTIEGICELTPTERARRETARDKNGIPLYVRSPMNDKYLLPNFSKQKDFYEQLSPEEQRIRDLNLASKLAFREELREIGIDPDSEEGLRLNPYENRHTKKMWAKIEEMHQPNYGKSEASIFIKEFYTRDLKHIKPTELYETNYTNKINFKGETVDISKYTLADIFFILDNMTINETNELFFTEHVQSLMQVSTPKVKLYYPEPYIAAPTHIHHDLWFLHILHYQFWLWFFFIFLVVFFFIVFLVHVRSGQIHNRPRRETRGVSRSKCGDLITACVPVSWAASIIISESTDSTDITDGFSTGELVVGVRAYQWGWEYYYPKNIDLNYNVKPSYSTFIGNSIKYTSTSDTAIASNHFWRHYQKKSVESIVTPAHLLLLPSDNSNVSNFLNFNDAGINTLKQSSAFAKIRANSKLFTTNVVSNADEFSLKYAKINKLAFGENSFSDVNSYGNIRQHNLLSTNASNNNMSTFLNKDEMTDFLTSNTRAHKSSTSNTSRLIAISTSEFYKNITELVGDVSFYTNQFNLLNNSSDVKHKTHIFSNIISKAYGNKDFKSTTSTSTTIGELPVSSLEKFYKYDTLNKSSSTIKTLIKGENTTVLPADQLVINYSNLKLGFSNYNLTRSNNPAASFVDFCNRTSSIKNVFNSYNGSISNFVDANQFNKLSSRRASFGYPHPIFFSNNPNLNIYEYDTNKAFRKSLKLVKNRFYKISASKYTPSNSILTGDQANSLPALNSAYWRMFWSTTDLDLRLSHSSKLASNESSYYLPLVTNYYDYDFRNAQAMELLEDAFWESFYSSYNVADYLTLSQNYLNEQADKKANTQFNKNFILGNISLPDCDKALIVPTYKDLSVTGQFYINSIESSDFIASANLIPSKAFSMFPNVDYLTNLDDSFGVYKNLHALSANSLNTVLYSYASNPNPGSYISVFNNFRADFEDATVTNNLTNKDPIVFQDQTLDDSNMKNYRLSNTLSVRYGVKNSIVTFNALRKVFRTRFDEGRSNTSLHAFSQSYLPQPFINDMTIAYTQLLSKDRNPFYQNMFHVLNSMKFWSTDHSWNLNQNYYFYDLPFLLAEGSDPQKFMWFDWWAKWGMYEVQPSSVAKYSTLGVPYSRKHFDFGAGISDTLQEVETYFIRIARLRKNYLPNWLYSPSVLNKLTVWNRGSMLFNNNYLSMRGLLNNMSWYSKTFAYSNTTVSRFTPSFSGNNTYMKSSWRPFSSIQAYFYKNSVLLDILTRREYMYRKYLQINKRIINLPTMLTCNPNNLLIDEIKSSFLLTDPISFSSESTRDVFYSSLDFFKFTIFKEIISDLSLGVNQLPINPSLVNEYLFFYAFNSPSNKVGLNDMMYKDQHRPLKKGITSMLRLHSTGAVAMPVDVRLQILASSRDVIHSWSIPSAGIKIDCVPGYTSHRIMTFNLTGIYWGQCQEICGRYHHWMPIVIYFMKRDLFFLWCTHFVFKSSKAQDWKISDRQYANYVKFVSYDKSSWLNELYRQL